MGRKKQVRQSKEAKDSKRDEEEEEEEEEKKGTKQTKGGKLAKGGKGGKGGKEDKKGKGGKGGKEEEEESEEDKRRAAKRLERETRMEFRRERNRKIYGKEEWDTEFKKFLKKLLPLGYFVREVTGDGNCLFRSIADQLEIEGLDHIEVREKIVRHITENRESYEPFIEDDVPFDRYISAMAKNGTWGGNLELQACSMAYTVNIKIFQVDLPCWDVVNWPTTAKTLFLSYHDGDHWNSVRPLASMTPKESGKVSSLLGVKILSGSNPAEIAAQIKGEFGEAETSIPQPVKAEPTKEERIIMENTGETDLEKVKALLVAYDGDTDAVISEIYRMRYDGDLDEYYENGGGNGGNAAAASESGSGQREYVILGMSTEEDEKKKKAGADKRKHMTKKQLKEIKKAQKRKNQVDDPNVKIISVNGAGDALIPSQKI